MGLKRHKKSTENNKRKENVKISRRKNGKKKYKMNKGGKEK